MRSIRWQRRSCSATAAEVNAQGGMFGTVLQAAEYSYNTKSIQILLDNGADMHDRFGKYGTALGNMLLEPAGTYRSEGAGRYPPPS